jgi:glycosyl-4,4'-diaponeurosporenoate acyltransferase
MIALIWVANVMGWPVIHLSVSLVTLRLPQNYFARDTWLTAPRQWEYDSRLYRDVLAIRAWKFMLPDGAHWLGGFAKKRLCQRDSSYLTQFLVETRRSEVAHWCMLGCLPLFFLWNPPWACCVMTAYALAANLPCILTQRYNRMALGRVLQRRRRTPECV